MRGIDSYPPDIQLAALAFLELLEAEAETSVATGPRGPSDRASAASWLAHRELLRRMRAAASQRRRSA